MRTTHGSLKKIAFGSLFAVLIAIILLPYSKNGFWADDALNSQTWGLINRFDSSVIEFSSSVIRSWLVEYGRILLPWPVIYSFFYIFKSELAVRLADMAMFIAHVSLTILLLRRIGISWRTIGFFILSLLALLQIRDSADPLAAFAGFSQGVGILLTSSLLTLHKWHKTKSAAWLVASSLIAALSMTFYEINSVYVPIAIVTILTSNHSRKIRDTAIIVVPFIIFITANLYVKQIALTPYAGAEVGNLSAVPATFLKQLFATLPGSFYLSAGKNEFPPSELFSAASTSQLAWAVMILWSAIAIIVLRREPTKQPVMLLPIFAAGMLLLVPPVLISISAKYQLGLTWGYAHIPVYYQCFGLAFLLAAAVDQFSRGAIAKWAIACVPLVGLGIALNWTMNMHQSAAWDSVLREPRDSLVSAMQSGIFDGVRDGDVVRIDGQPIHINGNLIYQTIEKNFSIPNEAAISGWFESPPRADAKVYRLVRDPAVNNQWKVVPQ
ncbi:MULTISPECIES: hypothetical protein [unclassified Pseudomonas]|uniref:hypothetical protein n=1 Tax=unclassified Pseudomonas TaxID=196821 RepID=UPI001CBBED81|nr:MULTISPECIES: hypothetical protein [unclassified Pseudomonas]